MNGIFITGTNTGVGKTWIGSQLVKHLYQSDKKVIPQKPIESGCVLVDGKLFAEDANHYFKACKGSTPEHQITPFRFTQVCSPSRASKLSKAPLKLTTVVEHINQTVNKDSFVVLEGAGGFYSPLTVDALNKDLATELNLPVLLIADDSLGSINAVLLSLKAIEECGLKCIAIVLNEVQIQANSNTNNFEELKCYTQLPVIKNSYKNNNAVSEIALLL